MLAGSICTSHNSVHFRNGGDELSEEYVIMSEKECVCVCVLKYGWAFSTWVWIVVIHVCIFSV
jgi:hypothetical protein